MDRRKESPSSPVSVQLVQLDDLQVEIPAQALAALAEALDHIAKGRAVDLQGVPPEVATREAAALLNLPHPRLLQLLDDGAIASRMANGRRRVPVVDLVAYRQAQAEASSTAMDELTRESERLNLGY
ncbi:helix-turn-helix domain-containing protein [Stutzerimonas stutzeri]|uniref:helix-turn-helix domain-containing protein n=1 Tax=Stutzerimonas stutzeri TaxID=316 RepID=UPI00244AC12D|nr:helix-turn-helix domain-containing protein [Stutzerimonas stutzeri]MDH1557088.1 helix-turn-helix domain-containing protein [Stutzerimonas stutzeri]